MKLHEKVIFRNVEHNAFLIESKAIPLWKKPTTSFSSYSWYGSENFIRLFLPEVMFYAWSSHAVIPAKIGEQASQDA